MTKVALSLGSNIESAVNIRLAVAALRERYGGVMLSPVFESEAVGFAGDDFLNLVAVIETRQSLRELIETLKGLEDAQGRDRSAPRFSGRTLDIDILTYGDQQGRHAGIELPRPEITRNAFVLWPLAEVLPESCHGPSGKCYRQLWSEFDRQGQRLRRVEFDWDGSPAERVTD